MAHSKSPFLDHGLMDSETLSWKTSWRKTQVVGVKIDWNKSKFIFWSWHWPVNRPLIDLSGTMLAVSIDYLHCLTDKSLWNCLFNVFFLVEKSFTSVVLTYHDIRFDTWFLNCLIDKNFRKIICKNLVPRKTKTFECHSDFTFSIS